MSTETRDRMRAIREQVRSDYLTVLRDLIDVFPAFAAQLGRPEHARFVIDANIVIGDIRWLVTKRSNSRGRTSFQEACASGTLKAFAPTFLDDEVRSQLVALSEEESIPLQALLATWEQYRTDITFYETARPNTTASGTGVVDPKDVPYIEAYTDLGAAAIITADPHLSRMGARTVRFEILVAIRDYSRAASVELTIKWSGITLVLITANMIVGLVAVMRWAMALLARLPPRVQVLFGLSVLAALLHHPTRARLLRALAQGRDRLLEIGAVTVPIIGDLMHEAERAHRAAETEWAKVIPHVSAARVPLRAHVTAVCAAAARPLTIGDLERELQRIGVKTGAKTFRRYLRSVLRNHAALIEGPGSTWQLAACPHATEI